MGGELETGASAKLMRLNDALRQRVQRPPRRQGPRYQLLGARIWAAHRPLGAGVAYENQQPARRHPCEPTAAFDARTARRTTRTSTAQEIDQIAKRWQDITQNLLLFSPGAREGPSGPWPSRCRARRVLPLRHQTRGEAPRWCSSSSRPAYGAGRPGHLSQCAGDDAELAQPAMMNAQGKG